MATTGTTMMAAKEWDMSEADRDNRLMHENVVRPNGDNAVQQAIDKQDVAKQMSDALISAIGGLAYEIARRTTNMPMRPESRLDDHMLGRAIRVKVKEVLVDYFVGKFRPGSYYIADDGGSITCTRCGMTSYNLNDVVQKYCAHCKLFHRRDDETTS